MHTSFARVFFPDHVCMVCLFSGTGLGNERRSCCWRCVCKFVCALFTLSLSALDRSDRYRSTTSKSMSWSRVGMCWYSTHSNGELKTRWPRPLMRLRPHPAYEKCSCTHDAARTAHHAHNKPYITCTLTFVSFMTMCSSSSSQSRNNERRKER